MPQKPGCIQALTDYPGKPQTAQRLYAYIEVTTSQECPARIETTDRYALIGQVQPDHEQRRPPSSEQVAASVNLAKLHPYCLGSSGGRVKRSTLQIAILDKPLPNADIPDQRGEHSDPNDGSNKGDAHEHLRK